ncbi:MAG TPA: 16S rRNA (cytidine(1402)-2'-O)-methyltransferase [Candidatus Polarisedimenticolia bacterium]|nr:16S rRNA (cytidine(1402)-2'-O)-methyltransferase [Candidatus Polarisedimenticolia bacterium]
MPLGTLYLVATPIGNLEDITLRALRILRDVPLIACEDTRQTRKLLNHHSLRTRTVPFHRFNEARTVPALLQKLRSGQDVALVTDGGTPSVSDPGVSLARAAREAGIRVVPVPGPSAPLAALVASGLPAERFSFFGFLPHRSGERRRLLESLRGRQETLIFFDSPRRVGSSLKEMTEIFGDRPASIGREMTKIHEEFLAGSLGDLAERLRQSAVRGEVTVVVGGAPSPRPRHAPVEVLRGEVSREMKKEGSSRRDAIRAVALRLGVPRREVYRAFREGACQDDESE